LLSDREERPQSRRSQASEEASERKVDVGNETSSELTSDKRVSVISTASDRTITVKSFTAQQKQKVRAMTRQGLEVRLSLIDKLLVAFLTLTDFAGDVSVSEFEEIIQADPGSSHERGAVRYMRRDGVLHWFSQAGEWVEAPEP